MIPPAGKKIYDFFYVLSQAVGVVKARFGIIILVGTYALLYWTTFTLHILNMLDQVF